MLAPSIHQPYAELILRTVKTVEYRSRPTRVIVRRFVVHAAREWAGLPGHHTAASREGKGERGEE